MSAFFSALEGNGLGGAARSPFGRSGAALRDAVAEIPRIKAYLASPRRIPFNEQGIFRRYPELDVGAEG